MSDRKSSSGNVDAGGTELRLVAKRVSLPPKPEIARAMTRSALEAQKTKEKNESEP